MEVGGGRAGVHGSVTVGGPGPPPPPLLYTTPRSGRGGHTHMDNRTEEYAGRFLKFPRHTGKA